jgi:hypothetical protein
MRIHIHNFARTVAGFTTTFYEALARLHKIFPELSSAGVRKGECARQRGPILTSAGLRWRYYYAYLCTLMGELRNVYRRMEIWRDRHLYQTGTTLLSASELHQYSHQNCRRLLHVRKRGIRKLLTILPGATLVDLHLATILVGMDLLGEDLSTEAQKPQNTSGSGLLATDKQDLENPVHRSPEPSHNSGMGRCHCPELPILYPKQ